MSEIELQKRLERIESILDEICGCLNEITSPDFVLTVTVEK